jgi:hypothetical protein
MTYIYFLFLLILYSGAEIIILPVNKPANRAFRFQRDNKMAALGGKSFVFTNKQHLTPAYIY